MTKLLNVFILVVLTTVITMALSMVTEEIPWKACNQSSHCLRDCWYGGCCVNHTCDCAYLWDGWNNCRDYYYPGSTEWYRKMYAHRSRHRSHHDASWRRRHPYNGYHG